MTGPDLVNRKHLWKELDQHSEYPFTLVTGPAGYGKSTLIASWLRKRRISHVWISLDDKDSHFTSFVSNLALGLRQLIPGFGTRFDTLFKAPQSVSDRIISSELLSAFSEIDSPVTLILDDYHVIKETAIHKWLSDYLKYPNKLVHLILISRFDPPLNLNALRMSGWVREIRTKRLRFTQNEIKQFADAMNLGIKDRVDLSRIETLTEGWAAGLRLLLTSVSDINNLHQFLNSVTKSQSVYFSLINKYLDSNRTIKDCVIRMAVLEEFNEDISKYILSELIPDYKEDQSWILKLLRDNFFLVPLDKEGYSFRFHHLIHNYLRSILRAEIDPAEINHIHELAAHWYQDHQSHYSAIKHFIEAEQHDRAVILFKEIRIDYLDAMQWHDIERMLFLFPSRISKSDTVLLLTRCWLLIYKGDLFEFFSLLPAIEDSVQRIKEVSNELMAEYNCLKAYELYNVSQDFVKCTKACEFAIEFLPKKYHYALGYSWIFLGGAIQITSDTKTAVRRLLDGIETTHEASVNAHQWMVICYLHWIDGNNERLISSAETLEKIGLRTSNMEALANSYYFLGIANLSMGQMDEALIHLTAFQHYRHHTIAVIHFMGLTALACRLNVTKNHGDARKVIRDLEELVFQQKDDYFSTSLQLLKAEFDFLNGDLLRATRSIRRSNPLPLVPASNFYCPQITIAKVHAAGDSQQDINAAKELIAEVDALMSQTKNNRFSIAVRLIKAQINISADNKDLAYDLVKQSIELSIEQNIFEPFLHLGHELLKFVLRVSQKSHPEFFKKLSSFGISEVNHSTEMPSKREMDILKLLREDCSNKQIAEALFISEKTVKRHCANLFKKLEVKNRRDAVAKGLDLNLFVLE